jgi:hypothetical protein
MPIDPKVMPIDPKHQLYVWNDRWKEMLILMSCHQ